MNQTKLSLRLCSYFAFSMLFACSDSENSIQTNKGVVYSGDLYDTRPSSTCVDHLNAGVAGVTDKELCRDGYAAGYNFTTRLADWVQYRITTTSLQENVVYSENIQEDIEIPVTSRSQISDYLKSGYDYGQLAPGMSMRYSSKVLDESFLLSNITPQVPGFRQSVWVQLEHHVRDCALTQGQLIVATGPLYLSTNYTTIGNGVAVPDSYYKVILKPSSPAYAWAFIVPNKIQSQTTSSNFLSSIDTVEAMTGLDFFATVQDDIEDKIEANAIPACTIPGDNTPSPATIPTSFDHSVVAENWLCFDCHIKPSTHFPAKNTCDDCHNILNWINASIDHDNIQTTCITCHDNVGAIGKPEIHSLTSDSCEICHDTKTWVNTFFDHSVLGAVTCIACHNGTDATGKFPRHMPSSNYCDDCHNTREWVVTVFPHSTVGTTPCFTCHNGIIAAGKGNLHIDSQNVCDDCHDTIAWINAAVNHANVVQGTCRNCHNGFDATGKGTLHMPSTDTCDSCHDTIAWVNTVLNHADILGGNCFTCHNGLDATGKGILHIPSTDTCDNCHDTIAWVNTVFNHADILVGTCFTCHNGSNASGKSNLHAATNSDCSVCHRVTSWISIIPYTHSSSNFPGRHKSSVQCTNCHAHNGSAFDPSTRWLNTLYEKSCAGCHADAFIPSSTHRRDILGVQTVDVNKDCGASGCHRVSSGGF